ncbi:cation:dicarboxylate symporter family transporter [Fluviispira multicolorata]|uniref:Cation:dicarboxylase symporter family transporter n=1 Tax=Fluviispira multicolorata TaxID=2654512 RepID=A0A833N275_9BACT|nr:cation:dicarboxylase symporter family transporter [Fluviispira multicolorata]KAB8032032.1 cation:dicarboxylase symporter family transporter [Fluviispira multicolorata]
MVSAATSSRLSHFFKNQLFLQVVIAVILGIIVGVLLPTFAIDLKIIAVIFIRFIKMVITPVVFVSIVLGVCANKEHRSIGKLAFKTLVYFEIMSVIAVVITFAYMFLFHPGSGFNVGSFSGIDVSKFQPKSGTTGGFMEFITHMVPESVFGTLAGDNLLAVIVLAVIFSVAILQVEDNVKVVTFFKQANEVFFKMIAIISRVSPIAAFAAISATVGAQGVKALTMLAYFILVMGISMVTFWILVYIVGKLYGFSAIKLMKHIKEEMSIAFGTSSSESVFPQLMEKLETFGCSKKVVSFVLPTGYAFNLDGTAIYVTAGAIFIQQAYNIPFGLSEYFTLLVTILIVSKGAAGITGAGFVTLSAILAAMPGHVIPIEGLALLLGIDRFMSDARVVTNIVGNTVGTVIIAKSEDEFTPT